MANYTKSVDFTSKDTLPTSNPLKVLQGSEFDTEFNAIASAIATKADLANSTLTGNTTIDNPTFTNKAQGATGAATVNNVNNVGYVFSSDIDSGLFNSAASNLELVVDGISKIKLDNTGTLKFTNGADSNVTLEVGPDSSGTTSVTSSIDFHSSISLVDYDARLSCTGDSTTVGDGVLTTTSKYLEVNTKSPSNTVNLTVVDQGGNRVDTVLNSSSALYNPITVSGDNVVSANGTTIDTETLALTTYSATSNGIRIQPNGIMTFYGTINTEGNALRAYPSGGARIGGSTVTTDPGVGHTYIHKTLTIGDNVTDATYNPSLELDAGNLTGGRKYTIYSDGFGQLVFGDPTNVVTTFSMYLDPNHNLYTSGESIVVRPANRLVTPNSLRPTGTANLYLDNNGSGSGVQWRISSDANGNLFFATDNMAGWPAGAVPYIRGLDGSYMGIHDNVAGSFSDRVGRPIESIGYAQTWANTTITLGTTYTNSGNRPIQINVYGSVTPSVSFISDVYLDVQGIIVARAIGSAAQHINYSFSAIVPPGGTYKLVNAGSGTPSVTAAVLS